MSERLEKELGGLILADREAWVRSTIIEAHKRFVSRGVRRGAARRRMMTRMKEEEETATGFQTHPVLDMSESEGEEEEEEDEDEEEDEEEEEDHASLVRSSTPTRNRTALQPSDQHRRFRRGGWR